MRSSTRSAATLVAILSLCCTLVAAAVEVPQVGSWWVRLGAAATVIGDYVYIDGGELKVYSLNRLKEGFETNFTLSIDISKSWTTSKVDIQAVPKPAPKKTGAILWTNNEEDAFYMWGGTFPLGQQFNISDPALWKFTADGKGGGEWSEVVPANRGLFATIQSGYQIAAATTDTTAFAIGGAIARRGQPDVPEVETENGGSGEPTLGGMVTYEPVTNMWANETENSPFPTLVGAAAHYLPSFGPNGLIILLGGYTPPAGEYWMEHLESSARDLYNLTFFDPQTKQVYWQLTTGDIPLSPRTEACTAVVTAPDGGYDIFLAGGVSYGDFLTYDDAYVLSLPGFVWTKVSSMPYGVARSASACVPMRGRQILHAFGYDFWAVRPDPAPNGLLLFDMATLQWKESYDADAKPYERPKDLQTWYNNGSFEQVAWSSSSVRQIFASARKSSNPSSTQNSGSNPTSSSGPSNSSANGSDSTGETESGSTSVAAIAGGVAGGVGGAALIAAAVWLFLRRRTKKALAGSDQDNNTSDEGGEIKHPDLPETDAPHGQAELTARRSAAEMSPLGLPVEATAQNRYEMEHQMRYEMEPQTRYEMGNEVRYEMGNEVRYEMGHDVRYEMDPQAPAAYHHPQMGVESPIAGTNAARYPYG
ncbi:hypothetical protein C7999DRAFT_10577 [Corynascus novoguineensis]|uniref:Kelch repeat protein n=1 Tax=Corynascus novoguineensis TaxID=1126955 RepID=A0AAN7D169_9PEZI|nr:hypothetical protein C7999DRAFT_10577 [Corynascus novoguineensis]